VPELVVHHYPSPYRNPFNRRWTVIRNELWFAWLRRPLPGALRTTARLALGGPWDRAKFQGFAAALRGLPWALRKRRVVPPEVEQGLRLLEARC
jgi:hypothetical protein